MTTPPSSEGLPFCDLVMEGGVTSGVIYPRLLTELAKHYDFKNLGGTSAGAIAASACAASQYRRYRLRHSGQPDMGAFDRLDQLPTELCARQGRGPTRLARLFQPQADTAPLLQTLLGGVRAFCKAYPGRLLVAALLPLLVAAAVGLQGWAPQHHPWRYGGALLAAGLLAGLAAVLAVAALTLWRLFTGALPGNGFGICKGHTPGLEDTPRNPDPRLDDDPLTLWLSRLLNQCAGLPEDGPPLTLGQLWSAWDQPPGWLTPWADRDMRAIELQAITTNLTHGRPYRLPDAFDEEDQALYFSPEELRPYFPAPVIEHLRAHARPVPAMPCRDPARGVPELPPGVHRLPAARDIPVVLVVRMSLSFPVLLSAVPLHAVNWVVPGKPRIERCWFSDGGITANFPIQFFDSPLPLWPTFGVVLEGASPDRPIRQDPQTGQEINRFYMPDDNRGGRGDAWDHGMDETHAGGRRSGAARLAGFAAGIVNAARNWHDTMGARSPGNRDRVIRIRLDQGEGGLNLNMPPQVVQRLCAVGAEAGRRLARRFAAGSGGMDFDNQRWMRLRTLVAALASYLGPLPETLAHGVPGAQRVDDLVSSHTLGAAANAGLCDPRYEITPAQAAQLRAVLAQLQALAVATCAAPSLADSAPPRRPRLQITPNV
jgi:predicted acylesterase/phospholipase RssA